MGRGRLEKNGAVVERGPVHPELEARFKMLPVQELFVSMLPRTPAVLTKPPALVASVV